MTGALAAPIEGGATETPEGAKAAVLNGALQEMKA